LGIFLLTWMAIALLPVLRYFALTTDLQGGRMAYMCCIPLCLMLTHGVAFCFDRIRLRVVAYTVAIIYISAGAFLTLKNNESWKQAGETMRAVHEALNSQYKVFPPNKILYFAGVPDQVHGAYAAVNAMEALFQPPQMPQELHMCNNLSPADLFEPYGYIRNTLLTSDACRLYTWDDSHGKFQSFGVDHKPLEVQSGNWKGDERAKVLSTNLPTRTVEVDLGGQGLNCWDAEFLQLKLRVIRRDNWRADSRLKMRFKNTLQPDYDVHSELKLTVQPGEEIQTLTVPLHSNVLWSLGGECRGLRFDYPAAWNFAVLEITPKNSARFIPAIELRPKTPATSLGTLWSNQVGSSFEVAYDVSQIKNAARAELEITKPNAFFLRQNADGPVVEAGNVIPSNGTKGKIAIETKNLSNGLLYEMRIRALDSNGHPAGFASDHIVFINSPASNAP
jgi:hypothetical protein